MNRTLSRRIFLSESRKRFNGNTDMDLFKPDISHGKCGRKSYGKQRGNGYHNGDGKRQERKLHFDRYSEKHAADDADHTALFAATDARAVNRAVTAGHATHGNNAVSDGANT